MVHLYTFHESTSKDEKFYIQLEWFNETIDLERDPNEKKYCLVTVTNLTEYWQCTVDCKLLLERFKPNNAMLQEHRNAVLVAAFQGESSISGKRIVWVVARNKQTGQLTMRLRSYYDAEIKGIAGSFSIDKASEDKKNELYKSWIENTVTASTVSVEANKAAQELIDVKNQEIEQCNSIIDKMTRREIEGKFTMMTNFAKLLNTKKQKITKEKKRLEEYKAKRERETEETDILTTRTSTKRQKTTTRRAAVEKTTLSLTNTTQTETRTTALLPVAESVPISLISGRRESTTLEANGSQTEADKDNDDSSDDDDVFGARTVRLG